MINNKNSPPTMRLKKYNKQKAPAKNKWVNTSRPKSNWYKKAI